MDRGAGSGQKGSNSESGYDKLAGEKTPQVALDTKSGDCEKNSADADEQSGYINQKCKKRLAETVNGAHQSSVGIQKRTDPCESKDKPSGCTAVEKDVSDQITENEKEKTAGEPQHKTAPGCFFEQSDHGCTIAGCLGSADSRQEHSAHGVCNSRGEENAGKSHTGQYSVCT